MVGGDAAHEATLPSVNTEHDGVLGGDQGDDLVDVAFDLGSLRARRQRDTREQHLSHGILAARAREDEGDRGQQVDSVQRDERGGP